MADKPILFSGPMVRALLAGTKTQTRRLFKPRGFEFYTHPVSGDRYDEYRPYRNGTWDKSRITGSGPMQSFGWREGLYGYLALAPGDRLYVREHWRTISQYDGIAPRDLEPFTKLVEFVADGAGTSHGKHRQGMHMPRWASRLTLTVTDVRVERLKDISEGDALAEGVTRSDYEYDDGECCDTAKEAYSLLWDVINGPGEWDANPWVAAYTFTVQRGNIDQIGGA